MTEFDENFEQIANALLAVQQKLNLGITDIVVGEHPNASGCTQIVICYRTGFTLSLIKGWISQGEVEAAVIDPDGHLIQMEEWGDKVQRGWTPDTLAQLIMDVAKMRQLPEL